MEYLVFAVFVVPVIIAIALLIGTTIRDIVLQGTGDEKAFRDGFHLYNSENKFKKEKI